MDKLKILKIYLWLLGGFLLFWWPMSHWFYPEWYHQLLGFESYDAALVKIIGTCGILPVLSIFYAAANPIRNRDFLKVLIVFCISMSSTYVYLISTQGFPKLEYINVAFSTLSGLVLIALYPYQRGQSNSCLSPLPRVDDN